jgi:hypothetical protein
MTNDRFKRSSKIIKRKTVVKPLFGHLVILPRNHQCQALWKDSSLLNRNKEDFESIDT